ncbi:MAG TPA: non-ribosomal peptide synthetase, partial [Myxococcales bacterium]|nr:non-ribosomal peptide synthetase [Myxococcales bacterium]
PLRLSDWAISSQCTAEVVNTYGPTECTDIAAFYRLEDLSTLTSDSIIPLGKANDRVVIQVLDNDLRPVPVGVAGELCIGGEGVGVGYLNDQCATREHFVHHPQHGGLIYRSGDLALWQADGQLRYLGRRDQQLKLRGLRIEPGEIEAALQDCGAEDAVVMVVEDRLTAWVVSNDVELLLSQLSRRLPAHLIPASCFALQALPLSPNGKVDRKSLLAHQSEGLDQQREIIAPRNATEEKLLTIWQRVLNQPLLSMTDNFFAVGGHSLLSIRLMTDIQGEFKQQLPLSVLLQQGTIESLAQVLLDESGQLASSPLLLMQHCEAPQHSALFCVHPIGGNVLSWHALALRLGHQQSVYGLQSVGLFDGVEAQDEVESMARRYVLAVRQVQKQGPYRLAGYSFGGLVAFEMARQLQAVGEQSSLLLLDAPSPVYSHQDQPQCDTTLLGEE